ncbi:MAG: tandem-95 repeat protein, partial [Candidatus Magnetomorum sp.]|nr:tandem-95 repeat protein [Candidatus Magnetomorum sp.]
MNDKVFTNDKIQKMPQSESIFLLKIRFILITVACCTLIFSPNLYATNKVATGMTHTIAITTLNTVNCVGTNAFGECSVSGWTDITQVAAGEFFSVGLDNNGNVFCAGLINFESCDVSAFDTPNIIYISAGPSQVVGVADDGTAIGVGNNESGQLNLSGWTNIVEVSCGDNHTVGLKNDNTVVCEGSNFHEQCNVSSWTGISQIATGLYYTIGLQAGTVLFTGWDNYEKSDFSAWNQGNITYISAGYEHCVAVDSLNTPYAAGLNDEGQCDVGTITVAVSEIVAGPKNTIGIEPDGELTVIGSTENDTAAVEDWQLINNPPEADAITISTYEDYTVTTINVLTLAQDYESHTLTVVPTHPTAITGTVTNHADGTYTYLPNTDHNGSDSFTYTVTDSQTYNYTGTALVSISITPVNDPPDYSCAVDLTVTEDAASQCITSWACSLTAGAYNESDQSLSLTWTCSNESLFLTAPVLSPLTGNASISGLTLTYAFAADEYGSATITIALSDNGGLSFTEYGAADTLTRSYVLTALSVNDAPTFTKGPDLIGILEDAVSQVYTGWATNVIPIVSNHTNEASQGLTFTVTNDYNALFSSQPAIDISGTTGTLSYTLAADMYGDTTVTVVLWDDGGTANGGVDRVTETFLINVLPVNDVPDFTTGSDRVILENSGGETVSSWATNLTQGAFNETDQNFTFYVSNSCNDCFSTQPYVLTSNGDLSYTLSADGSGAVTAWVILMDDGGTVNGGFDTITHSFTITITDINDPPGYTWCSNPTVPGGYEYTLTTVLEDADYTATTVIAWAINITQGSKFETWQALTFSLTNTNPTLFSTQPAIDSSTGTLSYTLAANENGSATVTAVLYDNGGTANGGVDRITETFVITVIPVNDAPTLTTGGDQTVLEDAAPVRVADWVTNISRGADNESAQSLDFTLTCDNLSLFVSPPFIELSGTTSAFLCYTLAANQFGATTVTMIVKDDSGRSNGGYDQITETFMITVTAVSDVPTITTISNQTVYENNTVGPLTFEIGDPDNDALTVTVSSSNPTMISDNHITFGATTNTTYTNTTRTAFESTSLSISIEPMRNTVGTATVTVNVTDGVYHTVNTSFTVTTEYTYHDGPGGVGNSIATSKLRLWMPADYISGLSDGLPVTLWGDKSGHGYTMTELANSPIYSSSFMNSKPAVVFDGSSNSFELTSTLGFDKETGIGIFAVINAKDSNSDKTIIARDSESNRGWGCRLNDSEQLSFNVSHSDSEAVTRLGTNTISDAYTIVSFLYDGSSGEMEVYIENTNESNTLENTISSFIGGTGSNLRVGNDGNNNFFKGSIAEVFIYDWAITPVEHILINNYLSSKYDIALSSNDKYTGDTLAAGDYDFDVAGIGMEGSSTNPIAMSGGLVIIDTNFLDISGDYFLVGHNRESLSYTVTNLPPNITTAFSRIWKIHINNTIVGIDYIKIGIIAKALGLDNFVLGRYHVLLKYDEATGQFDTLLDLYQISNYDSTPRCETYYTVNIGDLKTGDCITYGSRHNQVLAFNYDVVGNLLSDNHSLFSDNAIDLTNTSFTIEFWAEQFIFQEMYILGQGPDTWETDKNLNIGFTASNTIKFGFDATNTVETPTAISDSYYHHYAFTYNDVTREIKIYIDGVLDLTSTMSDGYSGTGLLVVGKAPGNSNLFIGDLDELRIWKTVRSNEEIFFNMHKSLDGNETDLHNYWQFNEGDFTTCIDKTATANHLNLSPQVCWRSPVSFAYEAPGWKYYGVPIGYTSVAQTETTGTLSFTGTDLTLNCNYHEGAKIGVTLMQYLYDSQAADFGPYYIDRYWVVNQMGDTPYDADFTFAISYFLDAIGYDALFDYKASLLWRRAGADITDKWSEIAYSSFQDVTSTTVIFEGIKAEGQFMIIFSTRDGIAATGNTLDFDGIDDFAVDETNRITLANASFTIEFWAQRSYSTTTHCAIGHSDNAQGLCIGFVNDEFVFSYSTNTASSGSYTDSDWHHWAVTFDSSGLTQTVYCDGVFITNNVADAPYSLTGNFYIGCGANQTNYFEGKLDEIRIWETARTQANIQDYMYDHLEGNETGLITNWRMDEPWSYTYINDSSTNSIHCVVNGLMDGTDLVTSDAWAERTTSEDVSITLTAGYDNDDTDFLVVPGVPSHGTMSVDYSINKINKIVYTPDKDYTGTDVLLYNVFAGGPLFTITMTILPVNDAPELGTITGQQTGVNTATNPISFTMLDMETASYSMTYTPTSSDTSLVLDSNISIECSPVLAAVTADCSVTITPYTDASGSLSITITVSDPEGFTATSVFALTVSNLPEIGSISDYTTTVNTSITPIAFTVTDIETANGDLQLTISTSNATILPINQTQLVNTAGSC